MREIWLRPNRRPLAVGLVAVLFEIGMGLALMLWAAAAGGPFWVGCLGGAILFIGCSSSFFRVRQWLTPRIAKEGDELLFFLHGAAADRVPLEQIECFFLGQGPTALPASVTGKQGRGAETVTIVVRLAEAATAFHHRDTRPELGHWCDGYITVRGTWCEPISRDLVQGLNERLIAAHRALRLNRAGGR